MENDRWESEAFETEPASETEPEPEIEAELEAELESELESELALEVELEPEPGPVGFDENGGMHEAKEEPEPPAPASADEEKPLSEGDQETALADEKPSPGDAAGRADDRPSPEAGEGKEPRPEAVVEALLFASSSPVPLAKLAEASGLEREVVSRCVEILNAEYDREGRAFWIQEVAMAFQMRTRTEYISFLQRLNRSRTLDKLSQAALETLAIIAYKQPIIRADIEAIRGVQSGPMIRSLLDRRLIQVKGRDNRLGHPLLYGTTKRFLEVFGLKSLKDLPSLEELKSF